jgi:hypothetical protein
VNIVFEIKVYFKKDNYVFVCFYIWKFEETRRKVDNKNLLYTRVIEETINVNSKFL